MNDPVSDFLGFIPEPYAKAASAAVGAIFILSGLCSLADAVFPQPVAGSRWVVFRRLVAMLAHNYANATNRIPPGLPRSEQAIATLVDAAVRAEAAPTLAPGAIRVSVIGDAIESADPNAATAPQSSESKQEKHP